MFSIIFAATARVARQ